MSSILIPGITELTAVLEDDGSISLIHPGRVLKVAWSSRRNRSIVDLLNTILGRLRQEQSDREFLSALVSDLKEDRGEIWMLAHANNRSGRRVLGVFHTRQEAERSGRWHMTNNMEYCTGLMVERWYATEVKERVAVALPQDIRAVCPECHGTNQVSDDSGGNIGVMKHCPICAGG